MSKNNVIALIASAVLSTVAIIGITNSSIWPIVAFVMLLTTLVGVVKMITGKNNSELNSDLWSISTKSMLICLVVYIVASNIYYNSNPAGGLTSWALIFQSLYALPFFFCGAYLLASTVLKQSK